MIYLVIYIISCILSLIILYYIIKSAVKNAILESRDSAPVYSPAKQEAQLTDKQAELKAKYDRGQITFDEYRTEWDN